MLLACGAPGVSAPSYHQTIYFNSNPATEFADVQSGLPLEKATCKGYFQIGQAIFYTAWYSPKAFKSDKAHDKLVHILCELEELAQGYLCK